MCTFQLEMGSKNALVVIDDSDLDPIVQYSNINAALLAYHGIIDVGATLLEARYTVEIIEESTQVADGFCTIADSYAPREA